MKKVLATIKKKKLLISFMVLVIVTGAFVGTKALGKNKTEENQQQIITKTAERGTIRETVEASGTIETANYLGVTTSVNGIVKKVYVSEGDKVYKGQPIMEITLNSDGEESLAAAWSSYLSAKNALDSAKTSLISTESALISAKDDFETEKVDNTYQTHDERISYSLAENAYEVAKQNHENQQSSITQKQVALNKAWLSYQAQAPTIVASGDGVIANIVVVEGMDISNSLSEKTSSTVASIKKEGSPIATLNISEVDINSVKVGQKVELTLNSIKDKTFSGTVVGIDKIGTASSGVANYPVIVKFDEESDLVLPNMGVDAEIIIQNKDDVVFVPSSAVNSRRGATMVKIQNGDEVTPVQVETGIKTSEYTEIISGLNEGDTVVINSLATSGFTSSEENNDRPSGGMIPGMGGGTGRPH